MTTLTEGRHCGEFLLSEAEGTRSRDVVTIASGHDVAAGTVLGKITSGGKYAPYDNGASDGTQTAVAIAYDHYDATDADVTGAVVIARDAEVIGDALTTAGSAGDVSAAVTDLKSLGIIVR
jgi:hypothetical protein